MEKSTSLPIERYMTRSPVCIQKTAPLLEAHRLMREKRVRHLPVLHGDALVGVVSDRDLNLLETLRCVDPAREPVSQAMSDRPFTVAPGTPLRDVAVAMEVNRYGSAIVVDGERVCGIFTTVDALRALADLLKNR